MLILFASLFACRTPQLQPMGESIGTGVSVGWAAAVAARAGEPNSPDCVERNSTCTEEPCAGTVVIDLSDPNCAFPLGRQTTGRIEAGVSWTGESALMGLRFLDMDIDGGDLFSPGISAVTVTWDEDGGPTQAVYVDQDIDGIESDEVDVSQSGWVVEVDLEQGPSNSRIELNGGGQRVDGVGEVVQLASVITVMEPSCRLNPTEGFVTMEKVSEGVDAGITGVTFDPDCDGKGKLEANIGLDVASSQRSYPIDLWVR